MAASKLSHPQMEASQPLLAAGFQMWWNQQDIYGEDCYLQRALQTPVGHKEMKTKQEYGPRQCLLMGV